MASLSTFGHLLMLQALRRTPLAVLTPFGYAQLAFATVFSWIFFRQVPGVWTVLGMAVIALSGIGTILLHTRSRPQSDLMRDHRVVACQSVRFQRH